MKTTVPGSLRCARDDCCSCWLAVKLAVRSRRETDLNNYASRTSQRVVVLHILWLHVEVPWSSTFSSSGFWREPAFRLGQIHPHWLRTNIFQPLKKRGKSHGNAKASQRRLLFLETHPKPLTHRAARPSQWTHRCAVG